MYVSLQNLDPVVLAGKARLAIENTLAAPEIAAAVAPPYTEAVLTAALADAVELEEAAREQIGSYGQQIGATATVDDTRDAFHRDTYMPHVELARVVFRREPGTLVRLGLDGDREEAFHLWAAQVRQLYATALADPALTARLEAGGVPKAEMDDALAALTALQKTEQGQEDRKGLAQQSTRDRDALKRDVAGWYGDYREVARVKLHDHPEWLERLGFLHRSDDPPETDS